LLVRYGPDIIIFVVEKVLQLQTFSCWLCGGENTVSLNCESRHDCRRCGVPNKVYLGWAEGFPPKPTLWERLVDFVWRSL
jgi:hypothetical protein